MSANDRNTFTPRETVGELDRYIVGQDKAKRAVAIALRDRWRRRRVEPELEDEIIPKNILMVGPTGVGKTEIARRLAKLIRAPFVKVEASKFTEVGYVGRDVESMVRDLVEVSVNLVRDEAEKEVLSRAEAAAENRILDILLPPTRGFESTADDEIHSEASESKTRETFRRMLREGKLDDREVEVEVQGGSPTSVVQNFGQDGVQDMVFQIQDMIGGMKGRGGPKQKKKVPVPEALRLLVQEETTRLVDMDRVQKEALERAQSSGIIFIDEIDKVAGGSEGKKGGPDVSREGVQRDLLPIVEGSSVSTKHGRVKTDHVLFIAAGAFHMARVSDLIPELQGRFPIRVELDDLEAGDFVRILKEPKNSLVRQYTAMLGTEGVTLEFGDDAIERIAQIAAEVNASQENIGARRLHTVMETLLEQISFEAPERPDQTVRVDADFVNERLAPVLQSDDLSRFVL